MADFTVRPSLADLEEYEVETIDADIVVNANESNYNLPDEVRRDIAAKTAEFAFNRYPPMKCENLCAVIAKSLGVDMDKVRVGNGSSELLQMACYAFGGPGKKIAVPYPSFSMYGVYAQMSDSEVLRYPLNVEGYLDADAVLQFCADNRPDLLIINNPNNPTGNYNPLPVVEKIIAGAGCPVIVDEAYMEFAKGEGVDPRDLRPLDQLKLVAGSALALLYKYSNFLVYKTFSKAYSMAGMRVGYAVGSSLMTGILGKTLLPYHVNAYTLMCAIECYEHRDAFAPQIAEIRSQRDLMAQNLEDMGMRVWPSQSNFLCYRPEGRLQEALARAYDKKYGPSNLSQASKAGKFLFKYMLEQKILLRDFTEHPALQGCIRESVGLPEENGIIMGKLRNICREILGSEAI
ncbi:MAG: aminotransferase class I/II-fold pyridoxal phosphate-dependent enzyme [Succiniclasticum sp.]|nr:aminotransferase class I/II-fold pyridoxal phosphate-dependent enzyme [Succiniclasticum sp.]MEE3478816.1 aminotransferase class I/II-fold pyridoxal phosphate-dependent enzyme [Succiniclasticum sp.]